MLCVVAGVLIVVPTKMKTWKTFLGALHGLDALEDLVAVGGDVHDVAGEDVVGVGTDLGTEIIS